VFAQGCPLKCEDCHNPQTHDFTKGELLDVQKIAGEIKQDPLLDGVTFSGGEPFAQAEEFANLADLIKDFNIICYSGYTFEELLAAPDKRILLEKIDILIDGRFEKSKKSLQLNFRGSKNQRIIHAKESLKRGKVIEVIYK
jgi:anaerobic ribonucleoside-triphosphate reductase activating protein